MTDASRPPRPERRRDFLRALATTSSLALGACAAARVHDEGDEEDEEAEVTPGEDLMQEHGVLERVSLKGSPTVSPTTAAASSGVPLALSSTSTTFLALSQAPPALAMKIAWKRPKSAIEIRTPVPPDFDAWLTWLRGPQRA